MLKKVLFVASLFSIVTLCGCIEPQPEVHTEATNKVFVDIYDLGGNEYMLKSGYASDIASYIKYLRTMNYNVSIECITYGDKYGT